MDMDDLLKTVQHCTVLYSTINAPQQCSCVDKSNINCIVAMSKQHVALFSQIIFLALPLASLTTCLGLLYLLY